MNGHGAGSGRSPARRGGVLAPFAALLHDPLFFVTIALLFLKSWLAILLINNPNHAAIDLDHADDYTTSPLIFLAFIAIPVSFGLAFEGGKRLAYELALDGAFSVLMVADVWYFRAYETFLSFLLAQEAGNLAGLWKSVFSLARPVDALFVADLLVLVPLALLRRNLAGGARRATTLAVVIPLAAAASLWVEHRRLDANGTDSDVRFVEPCWEARQTINFQSPLGFHVLDLAAAVLGNRALALSPAQRREIGSWFAANREALPDERHRGMFKGRDLIVVQVESLEGFVVSHSVAGQQITPVLDSLLPSSLYFTNIHDQAHEGLSSDSDLMTNTSVYPVRRGSTFFRFPADSYNSLPRILRRAGYRTTIAMHPDRAVFWNWKNALTAIGFDSCLDMTAFANDEILGLGLSDADFLPQVAARIAALPEPFYAFLVTLTSHAPFELPDDDCELDLDPRLDGTTLGTAFQCFRYTDRQIGVFLDRLRASGVLDRSVVVFYGDHASVHRFFNDEVARMPGLEPWMRDNRRLVPLIVYAPGLAGERIDVTGGHVDIMPTLLYLLGVEEQEIAGTAMGRNLLRTGRDFAVLPDGKVVGRDSGSAAGARAVEGLAIADLVIRSNYFASLGGLGR